MRRWAAILALAAGCGGETDLDGRPVLPAPLIVYAFAQPGCPLAERGAPAAPRLRPATS